MTPLQQSILDAVKTIMASAEPINLAIAGHITDKDFYKAIDGLITEYEDIIDVLMEIRRQRNKIMPPDRYVIYQEFRGQVQQVATCNTEAEAQIKVQEEYDNDDYGLASYYFEEIKDAT